MESWILRIGGKYIKSKFVFLILPQVEIFACFRLISQTLYCIVRSTYRTSAQAYLLYKLKEYLFDHWNALKTCITVHQNIYLFSKIFFWWDLSRFVVPKWKIYHLRWFLICWNFHISARRPLKLNILASTPNN